MKQVWAFLLAAFVSVGVWGQKVVLSGYVSNGKSGSKIALARVAVPHSDLSVVTNNDGFFTLKVDTLPRVLWVSRLGFQTREVNLTERDATSLHIIMQPVAEVLPEVVVRTMDPGELLRQAIKKIPSNYGKAPELYHCFYRETAMKQQRFIYVAEGVVDMYKTAYDEGNAHDRVAIIKGRRLLSPRRGDTLGIKVMGGPVQPIQLDIAKNTVFLLNEDVLACYSFTMEGTAYINDRPQYVLRLVPETSLSPVALYRGLLYIDQERLAFTRAELSLDMSDREKATRYMLVRKPVGVRFKPKELSCLIDYRTENGTTYLSYIRNTFRFDCDWKRKLFSTTFTASCEMVVTDRSQNRAHPLSGRISFDSRDRFFDRVQFFEDPAFWEDYNIIEPTETLDKAIDKLLKQAKR
ncbi:MAG: carboxypeptidase-like regulatory domain-containing protein [Bacteroidaceae bacterium]|nr:carboxypeptidase-like regulatory domain-containing protein [Bacteroidaceae bacterium]